MNAKLFAALTIFLFLFSITSYSPENSAFAESEYKTQENSQTIVRPLTGRWKGTVNWTSSWVEDKNYKCKYEGNVTLNLQQNGNVATGNGKTHKVKVLKGGKECKNINPFGSVSFNVDVVESSFSGTVYNGLVKITKGEFTSNHRKGRFFSDDVPGGVTVEGSFEAWRK